MKMQEVPTGRLFRIKKDFLGHSPNSIFLWVTRSTISSERILIKIDSGPQAWILWGYQDDMNHIVNNCKNELDYDDQIEIL